MTKQKPSHRKALRSAAAKKGWETRRIAKYWEQQNKGWKRSPFDAPASDPVRKLALKLDDVVKQPHPKPWHPQPFLHRLWSKLVGR